MATPPTFTLYGNTSGGPPVEYTWTRNGAVITNNDSYSISIRINNDAGQFTIERLSNAYYRSILIVTSVLPGVYQYSVNNKATPTNLDRDFNIEGNKYHPIQLIIRMNPSCLQLASSTFQCLI